MLLTATSLLALVITFSAAAQGQSLPPTEPSCPLPFGGDTPTCFCARTRDGVWSVTCGCQNFAGNADVLLTPRLLPSDDASSLLVTIRSCQGRRVRLSGTFLRQLADFTDISLDISDAGEFIWDDVTLAEHSPFSIVAGVFRNVRLPRIPSEFFSHRLSVSVEFEGVEIGEILSQAFESDISLPIITIRRSRIESIAMNAFAFPQDAGGLVTNRTTLLIADSEIGRWESEAYSGGERVEVVDSVIGRLETNALFTGFGLQELRWINNRVEEAEPQALLDGSPQPVLNFVNNSFNMITPSTPVSEVSVIHFTTGTVPASFTFFNNTITNATGPPVTPEPNVSQVEGTRLQCECGLLAWLSGTVFEGHATCVSDQSEHEATSQLASQFLATECNGNSIDRVGGTRPGSGAWVEPSGPEVEGAGADDTGSSSDSDETTATGSSGKSSAIRPTHVLILVASAIPNTLQTVIKAVLF